MEVGKLTVFHSCLSTCVKRQVSRGQAFGLCLCTVMLSANCGGTRHCECTVSEKTEEEWGDYQSHWWMLVEHSPMTFYQDVLGWLR